MKILTIITINYNNLNGLKKTVKSVESFKENNYDIEYIIVDGGSSDGSVAFVNNNLEFIDLVISERDNGIYDAMNKGIEKASGDFVIFMNSGDCFHYDFKLKDYINALKNIGTDGSNAIVYGDVLHSVDDAFFRYLPVSDDKEQWWMKNTPCHQSLFLPSCFLKKNKFNLQYSIYADADQMLKAFNELPVKIKINKAVSIFEIGGACSSASGGCRKFLRNCFERRRIYRDKSSAVLFILRAMLRYFLLKILGDKRYYLLSAVIFSYRTH